MIQVNNNLTMYGIWYSPYKPGVRIRGVLERKDFDKTLLNIYCLSEYEYESFKNAKVIQGINSIGQNITLLDCFVARGEKHSIRTTPNMQLSKKTKFIFNTSIFVNFTLVGLLVPDASTKLFQSISFESKAINNWCYIHYYKYKGKLEKNEPIAQIYKENFLNDELEIAVIAIQSESFGLYNEQKNVNCKITISKKDKELISIQQAIDIGFPFLMLLPLLCDQDHGCVSVDLNYANHGYTTLYFNDSFFTQEFYSHVGDLLSLDDLNMYLPSMLTSWYKNYSKYIRMSNLFRHTLSNNPIHINNKISDYVRILEMMLKRDKYILSNCDKKVAYNILKLLDNISNEKIKAKCKEILSKGLDIGNSQCFISYLESKFYNNIYFDQLEESLKLSIKIRNSTTHLNEHHLITHRERILQDLSIELLHALIKIKLLEKLGVPDTVCMNFFENDMHFHENKCNFEYIGKMLIESE